MVKRLLPRMIHCQQICLTRRPVASQALLVTLQTTVAPQVLLVLDKVKSLELTIRAVLERTQNRFLVSQVLTVLVMFQTTLLTVAPAPAAQAMTLDLVHRVVVLTLETIRVALALTRWMDKMMELTLETVQATPQVTPQVTGTALHKSQAALQVTLAMVLVTSHGVVMTMALGMETLVMETLVMENLAMVLKMVLAMALEMEVPTSTEPLRWL